MKFISELVHSTGGDSIHEIRCLLDGLFGGGVNEGAGFEDKRTLLMLVPVRPD